MCKANPLPLNWRQQLAESDQEEQLRLLPLIERHAAAEADAWTALLPLAESANFALRLRALVALARLEQGEAFLPLVELLKRETVNHWRLAMLDTLAMLPYRDKIGPLLPLLATDQPADGDAYFLSGLIWFLGQQGACAIAPLTQLVLAKPVRARRIKDGLLAEAFFLAAGGSKELLAAMAAESPPLYRFCSNRIWPPNARPHYGIYPNPDYLLQKALKAGLSQGQYKRLHYWQRDKAGPPNI